MSAEMSWMKVDGTGWRRMELGGGGWNWVELGGRWIELGGGGCKVW